MNTLYVVSILLILILLILLIIGMGYLLVQITQLEREILELQRKIIVLQYQMDDVLCDINSVNQNVLNAYGILNTLKEGVKNE